MFLSLARKFPLIYLDIIVSSIGLSLSISSSEKHPLHMFDLVPVKPAVNLAMWQTKSLISSNMKCVIRRRRPRFRPFGSSA